VLTEPVISSAPLSRWESRAAILELESGDSCLISYRDSSTGPPFLFRYTIDTGRWLVRRLQKVYSGAYSYTTFDAAYAYDWVDDSVPRLTRVALWGDTTLSRGGYRFREIEVNVELDDSLFVVNAVRPWSMSGDRVRAQDMSKPRIAVNVGRLPIALPGSAVMDLSGRRWQGRGEATVPSVRGVMVLRADE
jgi:hypothetical protein